MRFFLDESLLLGFFLSFFLTSFALRSTPKLIPKKIMGRVGGQRWGDFDGAFDGTKIVESITTTLPTEIKTNIQNELISDVFQHLGDIDPMNDSNNSNNKKSSTFYLNVGKALEALRRELPMVFAVSNLDFSIFANSITVTNGNQSKMVMSKSLYTAAIKSMRMAASFSSIYPSMNVKKIEYIEECQTIQCLVDVVLPDSVRIDGQAVWEGMFYFGLDSDGLISTHIFDRKISNMRPTPLLAHSQMPWLRNAPSWSSDLLSGGVPVPQRGLVTAVEESESEDILIVN